jgi:hypothetical protein
VVEAAEAAVEAVEAVHQKEEVAVAEAPPLGAVRGKEAALGVAAVLLLLRAAHQKEEGVRGKEVEEEEAHLPP